MRAPKKVIAAMAMATLLGGTGLQVFAATPDFTETTGNIVQGQLPSQETNKPISELKTENAQGDIKIEGNFYKAVDSFPTVTQKGRYLRITMPISLNYKYDLERDVIKSAKGSITNRSLLAEGDTPDNLVKTSQPVNMTFLDLEETTSNENIQYVAKVNHDDDSKAQLPIALVLTTSGNEVTKIPLASMKDGKYEKVLKISADDSVDIELDKMDGQDIFNPDIIGDEGATIGHKMKLKFEYAGN